MAMKNKELMLFSQELNYNMDEEMIGKNIVLMKEL